jgi:2-C-methyl-D-erythritol 4-phosphate cytidylyltransferase
MNLAIVIAGAGTGSRFGSDKLEQDLDGTTVLEGAVERLRSALPGVPTVVAVRSEKVERWRSVLVVDDIVAGGKRRQDSVQAGVEAAIGRGASHVVIHDAARPMVHPDDVRAVLDAVDGVDGATLCTAPVDTVKRVAADGTVIRTLDRGGLRLAQTPQVCRVAALAAAWAACDFDLEWSDEAAALEAAGLEVRTFEAQHPNPKITTPADLELVRILLGGGR